MRLPRLTAESADATAAVCTYACTTVVRACMPSAGDWRSPRSGLGAPTAERSTGVILHSRPKHLNTRAGETPWNLERGGGWGGRHVHVHALSFWPRTKWGGVKGGWETPAGSPDMQPFTFPRRDFSSFPPSSFSPPLALKLALKGSTYIPNLQATCASVIQLGEERERERE